MPRNIYILNSTTISTSDLNKANKLLHRFYYLFASLYSERYLTLNLHQLVHLTHNVRNLGPLHTFSCFDHEDTNGLLVKMVHSTHRVDLQLKLTNTFTSLQSICTLAQHRSVQVEYLNDIIHSPPLNNGIELFSPVGETPIDPLVAQLFEHYTSSRINRILKYNRLKIMSCTTPFIMKGPKNQQRCHFI